MLPRLCDSINLVSLKIDVGNCKIHVELEGKGEPMLLINGGPGGTHHYFHPWFSQFAQEFKIIYYDQRGTGESDFEPGNGYSFEQAVNDLEFLRQRLGHDKWVLCGYSYGGALAQYYSLKFPENVKGMILVNALPMMPNVSFESEQELYFSEEEKDRKKEIIKAYTSGELAFNAFLYNLYLNGDWKRQKYLKPTAYEMIRAARYEWVNDDNFNSMMSNSFKMFNFEDVFDNNPIPTLLLEGGQDLTWGKNKHQIFRDNHPNAQYFLINRAGHPIFSESPEVFHALVSSFISKIDKVPAKQLTNWKTTVQNMNLKQ
jgi:proline iminopeptidase